MLHHRQAGMNDEELVAGLISGDIEAQISLLDGYQERLIYHLLKRFPKIDEGDIEQIVANSIYRVIIEPTLFDLSKGTIWKLLSTITWRKATDLLDKQQRASKETEIVSLSDYQRELIVDEASMDCWHDDRLHNQESQKPASKYPPEVVVAAQKVIEALKLTEEQSDHIRLRLVEKLPPKEIAVFIGSSSGYENVKWHRLMKRIESEWVKYPELVEYARQKGMEVPQV